MKRSPIIHNMNKICVFLTFPCIISLIVRVTLESSSWRLGVFSGSMLEDESVVSRGILAAYGVRVGRQRGHSTQSNGWDSGALARTAGRVSWKTGARLKRNVHVGGEPAKGVGHGHSSLIRSEANYRIFIYSGSRWQA